MRCVLDTNVLISALLLPDSTPRQALNHALKNGRILFSLPLLTQLSTVLARRKFRRYLDEEDARAFLIAITREAEWVDISTRIIVCRDPNDNKLLELAVSGQASHRVTGDSDLLVINRFRGIQIVQPQAFLAAR